MKLLAFLKDKLGLVFNDPDDFPTPIGEQVFEKGAVITDYGQVERKIYFIDKGLVQLTVLHDGEERIVEFFSEHSFVSSYSSFIKQEPSDCRITTLTSCETEVIRHSDLQKAYETSLLANKIGRIFTEQIYMVKGKREKDFLSKSAVERYEELVATRPDIIRLVLVNKIAKYLGLHPESLSRIRRSGFPNIG